MIDLKELMQERSAHAPAPAGLRLGQIQRKIAQRRHRRIAAVASCAVVVFLLAFAGYRFLPAHRTAPLPAATPTATPSAIIDGFPEYSNGFRVVASGILPPGATTMDLTWTVTSKRIGLFERCPEGARDTWIRFQLADHDSTTSCSSWSGFTVPGLALGQPVTAHLTFSGMPSPQGDYAVAIGEPVAFDSYPLPPRPATLKAIPDYPECEALRSDRLDPLQPVSIQVVWKDTLGLTVKSQTPGMIQLTVNGVVIDTADFWNYDGSDWHFTWDTSDTEHWTPRPGFVPPVQGEMVTLTAIPRYLTGAWVIALSRGVGSMVQDSHGCIY